MQPKPQRPARQKAGFWFGCSEGEIQITEKKIIKKLSVVKEKLAARYPNWEDKGVFFDVGVVVKQPKRVAKFLLKHLNSVTPNNSVNEQRLRHLLKARWNSEQTKDLVEFASHIGAPAALIARLEKIQQEKEEKEKEQEEEMEQASDKDDMASDEDDMASDEDDMASDEDDRE